MVGQDMNWSPGDSAILVRFDGDIVDDCQKQFIGEECELIARAVRHDWQISVCGETKYCSERHLRKPYDGHGICSEHETNLLWKMCDWQPKETETVTT